MAVPPDPRRCYMCSFCSQKNYPLVKHLFEAHSHDASFHFDCPIDECSHTFSHRSTFSSLLSHMNRKHPFWKDKLESSGTVTVDLMPSRETTEVPADLPPPPEADVNSSPTTPENESTVCSSQVLQDDDSPVSNPRATAAKFLLMLKERHNMTQTALSFAIDSVKRLHL